jgi:hypothetical protein
MVAQISVQLPHVEINFGNDRKKQLRRIYWELENANENYGGHKLRAMEEIRHAAEIMGMDLHGEGYPHGEKPMEWSNGKLHEARDQLADLAEHSGGREQEHLREAVHEIDRALDLHPAPPPVAFGDDQRRELRAIYFRLENVDRDYHGHRRAAIEEIRQAAEIMGMDLHGHGEPEREEWSDHRLHETRDRIADLAERSHGPEREHLREAAHQLDLALQ